jgi:hypothetical protein
MSDFGNIGPLIVDFFVKIKDPLFIIYAPIAGVFAWKAKRYYFVGSTILIFGINLLFAMAFWAHPKIPHRPDFFGIYMGHLGLDYLCFYQAGACYNEKITNCLPFPSTFPYSPPQPWLNPWRACLCWTTSRHWLIQPSIEKGISDVDIR